MPERFPPAIVEQLRSRRLVYAGQYQQNPAPVEGNLIKRSEVRYYGGIDPRTGQPDEKLPEYFDQKIVSVNCSFKDTATCVRGSRSPASIASTIANPVWPVMSLIT
jgi:hypothetical protein